MGELGFKDWVEGLRVEYGADNPAFCTGTGLTVLWDAFIAKGAKQLHARHMAVTKALRLYCKGLLEVLRNPPEIAVVYRWRMLNHRWLTCCECGERTVFRGYDGEGYCMRHLPSCVVLVPMVMAGDKPRLGGEVK